MKIRTAYKEMWSANSIGVTVGSNCPQGGDSGHGGRTYLGIKDLGGTDMRVVVNGRDLGNVCQVDLIFGGDAEHDTFIQALEFALEQLRAQAAVQHGPEIVID